MTILLVDDQESVLNGLLDGIHWSELKIDTVLTAQNAVEARAAFGRQPIDIVLCDIEMPVESGLDFFHWVRAEKYDPYFVFLTSHAEFSYAQEAVRLGASDYIVQPAPYGEIVRVVKKGIQSVQERQADSQAQNRGTVLTRQQKRIAGGAIRNLLNGLLSRSAWDDLQGLGLLPKLGKKGYLVMLQIVRWNTVEGSWESALLEAGLENVVGEIFMACDQVTGVAAMTENLYAILLQSREDEPLPAQELERQFRFLSSVCVQYFNCDVALYYGEPELVEHFDRQWKTLKEQSENNVLQRKGIFRQSNVPANGEHRYHLAQVPYWKTLLSEGCYQAVEEEAVGLLGQLSQNGIDKKTLGSFYQDYLQMLYSVMDERGRSLSGIFSDAASLELYRNAIKSVRQMEELIHYTLRCLDEEKQPVSSQQVVEQVVEYIQAHLEDELRRDDIAMQFHLNRDYLSRMFSKEMGISLKEYITVQKMKAAQSILKTTHFPIGFIGAKFGYCNSSHFSQTYKRVMGRTPQEERSGEE